MDLTNTQPGQPSPQGADMAATIRVGSPQPAAANGDQTLRPGTTTQQGGDEQAADFTLKGRTYRAVKCLSDNSGEAQVSWWKARKGRGC